MKIILNGTVGKVFNFSGYTQSTKSCNVPLKSPLKWLPRMQKRKSIFQLLIDFQGNFSKYSVFEK